MNLLVDSGNTYTKVALCDAQGIVEIIHIKGVEDFREINRKFSPVNIIVSSVNKDASEIIASFPNSKNIILDASTPVPIINLYKTPSTLGMDRLAAVVGASSLFPGSACLCIDAGTCITYDIIDEKKQYYGGSISPGIDMRLKALHTFTAKLPLVQRQDNIELIGNTTEGAILSGVQIGVTKEMQGVVDEYLERFKDLKIIITGGDAIFFESRIKGSIFAEPELLFFGLKRIVEYNVS